MHSPLVSFAALLLVFVSVAMLVLGISQALSGAVARRRLKRLVDGVDGAVRRPQTVQDGKGSERLRSIMESLSRLSLPKDGWQTDSVRLKFVQAGFVGDEAMRAYYATKTLLVAVCPVLVWLYSSALLGLPAWNTAFSVIAMAAVGYYAPDAYLRRRIDQRADLMREALPDALDLLVICTESGLGMDQALGRVSTEMARSNKLAASELYLTTLEVRAGGSRAQALRNLALRIKLDDLGSLAAMLIQADRFGTSMGDALRTQSELMRLRRMQRAEEIAAKVPAKLLLPLILLIFPALMMVILGPAALRIIETLA